MNDHLSNRQVLYGPCVPLLNFNPNHDPNNGQFTSGDGNGGSSGNRKSGTRGVAAELLARFRPLNIVHGIPPKAQFFSALDGTGFLVPPGTDFQKVYDAGKDGGTIGVLDAVGHYGTFDFQRNEGDGSFPKDNVFYPAYTDASNYAVGVYLKGAGYTEEDAVAKANGFASKFSSNYKPSKPGQLSSQERMWRKGWEDADKKYSGGAKSLKYNDGPNILNFRRQNCIH